MAKSAPLSFPELWEIDHQFNKAGAVITEARNRLEVFDYDLAVRLVDRAPAVPNDRPKRSLRSSFAVRREVI